MNGFSFSSFSLTIVDQVPPITMLTSTNLPSTADFINQASFIGVSIDRETFGTVIHREDFGPGSYSFTASTVPEPATASLAGVALGLVAIWRRMSSTSPR